MKLQQLTIDNIQNAKLCYTHSATQADAGSAAVRARAFSIALSNFDDSNVVSLIEKKVGVYGFTANCVQRAQRHMRPVEAPLRALGACDAVLIFACNVCMDL